MSKNNKIVFVYTGGTLGGLKEGETITKDVVNTTFSNYLKKEFFYLLKDYSVECVSPFNKLSENLKPNDWSDIARIIYSKYVEGCKGIVVGHGTDTMVYTGSVLSFMLQGIKIPIILTGSNYSFQDSNTDARNNILCALSSVIKDQIKGIYVCFYGLNKNKYNLLLPTRCLKRFHKGDYVFLPYNYNPIAEITISKFFQDKVYMKIKNKRYINFILNRYNNFVQESNFKIENKVALIKIFPGFDPSVLKFYMDRDYSGYVFEFYGWGTACIEGKYNIIPYITTISEKKIPVCVTSQHFGNIKLSRYGTSLKLTNLGVIPLNDMLPDVALAKLMWVLGKTKDLEKIKNIMMSNIAEEVMLK